MNNLNKSLLMSTLSALLIATSLYFYRYTNIELNTLNQAQTNLSSLNSRLNVIKQKLKVFQEDESTLQNINMSVVTNFKISMQEDSLKQLIKNIEALYSHGLVIVKRAKIQSDNNTLHCTIEGSRIGM